MKLSNTLFISFFVWFLLINVSKNILGLWHISLYLCLVVAGFYLCQRWVRYFELLESSGSLRLNSSNITHNVLEISKNDCFVCLQCHGIDCSHGAELQVYHEPWKCILVHPEVNAALEDLLNFVLEKHTASWLPNVVLDTQQVLDEFRRLIRLVCSSLVLRIHRNINLSEFCLERLPKYLINHLEIYISGKRKAKSAGCVESCVLSQYGKLVHPALTSVDNESRYLKMLAHLITQTSFSPRFLKCEVSSSFLNEFIAFRLLSPIVEIMSDPENINILLLYLFEKNVRTFENETQEHGGRVQLLSGFSTSNLCHNPLGIELKQVLEDSHLLFLFTNYSKEERFTKYLQFKLEMDSLLTRLTNPEFTECQLQDVHKELSNIWEHYLNPLSEDYIQFDAQIVQDLQTFSRADCPNLQQLQNCRSLYDCIEHVQSILNRYCAKFFETDVYLKLVCGQRSSSFNVDGNVNKLDGKNCSSQNIDSNSMGQDDEDEVEKIAHSLRIKDLTGWSTSIKQVLAKIDSSGRENFLFQINVNKLDEQNNYQQDWTVERQFNEFYILESKLKEFHGEELDKLFLPAKKTFQRVTTSLMESYMLEFERFLNLLLLRPNLRRSELIYNFLCLNDFNVNLADNFKLSRIIKNVPSKFAKERGQHLYSFLRNFLGSCEKKTTLSVPPETPKRRKSASTFLDQSSDWAQNGDDVKKGMHAHLEYVYDLILLILVRFYNINNWFLQLLYMFRPLARGTFQNVCERFVLDKFRNNIFTPRKVVHFIDLLKQSMSDRENAHSGDNLSKNQRSQLVLKSIVQFVPPWVVEKILGMDKHEDNSFLVFSILQHRLLNKQLLYLLLDSVVGDLFPGDVLANANFHA